MTVFYDVGTEVHRSTSAATVTFTHTATAANVMGVAVAFVKGGATQPTITAVSYGGVALVQIARATDTAGEQGAAEWWSVTAPTAMPQGAQTVAYNTTTIASNVHVVVTTFTGAHPIRAVGSGTKSGSTASFSVSLTTGYMAGYALGAFYGGGAEPATMSYSVDRTLIHDWDMGAFYSEVFRSTNAFAAGSGPLVGFGGDAFATDDVAFAAIYLSDNAINPAIGATTAAGLVPVVTGFVFPAVGATTASGLAVDVRYRLEVTLLTELKQNVAVGLATTLGRLPVIPEPPVEATTLPGVGLVTAAGLVPDEYRELTQPIAVGAAATVGQIPDEYRELNQGVAVGLVSTGGQIPSLLGDGAIGPTQGLVTTGGLAPGLFTELRQGTGIGLAVLEGRLPVVSTGDVEVEGTALPGVGLVTLIGAEPSLVVEYDKPRGHVIVKKRRRSRVTPFYEESRSLTVVVPEIPPVPVAYWEPPADKLAGFDTAALALIDTALTELQQRRALIARRRREEEELITLWLRAA